MIDRFWRARGAILLKASKSPAARLEGIATAIERQGKRITLRTDGAIEFKSAWKFGLSEPRGRLLMLYDRGRVWIEGDERASVLRYELSSLSSLICCLVFAAIGAGVALTGGNPGISPGGFAGWVVSAYGMISILSRLRAPGFFKKAV